MKEINIELTKLIEKNNTVGVVKGKLLFEGKSKALQKSVLLKEIKNEEERIKFYQ